MGKETKAKMIVKNTGDCISFLYGSILVIKKYPMTVEMVMIKVVPTLMNNLVVP